LTKWSVICGSKYQGGLGVHDLEVKNRALLGKWLARLLTEDDVYVKDCCGDSMLAQKRFLRFFGNLETHIFGLALWQLKNTFF
jgi:hypothetical protein